MMKQGFFVARRRFAAMVAGSLALVVATAPAGAVIDPAHEFVVNGNFEQTTNGLGQLRRNTNVVGWTSNLDGSGNYGFTFVFDAATVSSGGVPGETGPEMLWGPGNGAANGLGASPGGGNFIGADGAYHLGTVTQLISGLIVGQSYQLTFNYAGAEEYNYGSPGVPFTDSWKFGFTGQGLPGVTGAAKNQQTAILNNTYKGFTGWQTQTYNFVATQTSDTLYFLAQGTPGGQPPFSLLDSVSLVGAYGTVSAAPEASTWAMMLLGFGIVGISLRDRRRRAPAVRLALA